MFDSLLIAAVGSNSSPSDNAKSGGETYLALLQWLVELRFGAGTEE
jgi:hypothetical protein